jgi:DnaJ-class molecular chaperone
MMYHPDRNPGFSAEATERLKQINRAKDELLAWVRQNAQQT